MTNERVLRIANHIAAVAQIPDLASKAELSRRGKENIGVLWMDGTGISSW